MLKIFDYFFVAKVLINVQNGHIRKGISNASDMIITIGSLFS